MSRAIRERSTFGFALAVLVGWTSAFAQGGDYETPPVLQAADLVDASLLAGPHHRVDAEVRNDGFMNHFQIRSDFGDFEAESQELLEIRVLEVAALAKLAEISRTEAFAEALMRSAAKPVTAVQRVASDPKGTVQGIPEGLNNRFKGLYYKAKKTGRKAHSEVQKQLEDDQPNESLAGEAPAAASPAAGGPAGETQSGTQKTVDAVKKYAGWESAKRQLAASLGIDPYSTNPVLQAELERLASAAFAGGLTFQFAMPGVEGLSVVEELHSTVYKTPPEELERRNDKALKDSGIDAKARFAFFDNPRFTLTFDTRLVEALERLTPAAGCAALIDMAASAETELEARFFTNAAELMAGYHASVGPLRELVAAGNDDIGRVFAAVTEGGTLVVVAPVDYLIWQPGMEGGRPLSAYAQRELWVTGRVSPRAKKELAEREWTVKEEVSFGS